MRKLIVSERYDHKKLSVCILENFTNLNLNHLYKALRKKDIRVNQKRVTQNIIVYQGDEIAIYIEDDLLLGKDTVHINVVYEDENIFIINKPEGISVTKEKETDITITSLVKKQYGVNLEPCHRLDRNTKGLLIYAKNQKTLHIMQDKFKNQEIEKHYKANVYGIPQNNHAILEAYLFKDRKKSMVYISEMPKREYLHIKTEYTVINKDIKRNMATLDVILHTGRTHQIRAHLAYMGYPIIGDGKYGVNEVNKKFGKKTQELFSYKLIFKFTTESGILAYLKDKEIKIE